VVPPNDARNAARLVAEALEQYAGAERFALTIWKDFPADERDPLNVLASSGYTRLAGFPPLELRLDFRSFDEYVETRLSKATRKNLRRKLRAIDAASPPLALEVLSDAASIVDEIYPLYLAVTQRSEVEFEVFTREYFREASQRMPGRFRYFVWRQHGRTVAFSFCTVWKDTIYDNDIGLDYSVAHELNLYHVTFRDIISWALSNGFTRYCSAPFNYETKLHLRLKPVPVDIYVRHRSSMINAMLHYIAPLFAPAQSDAALRRYFAQQNT
jgi:predicted N-acyltransferase